MISLQRIWRRPKLPFIVIGLSIALPLGLLFFTEGGKLRPLTMEEYYQRQLGQISTETKAIDTLIHSQESLVQTLKAYEEHLRKAMKPCYEIRSRYEKDKNGLYSQKMKDKMSQVNQFCQDFLNVTEYARAVSGAQEAYVGIETTHWPLVPSNEFLNHIHSVQDVASQAKAELQAIKNQVEDPGLPELITQVQQSETSLLQITVSYQKRDYTQVNQLNNKFIKELNRDKTDFQAARRYFWVNTVGIESLTRSVERLKNT